MVLACGLFLGLFFWLLHQQEYRFKNDTVKTVGEAAIEISYPGIMGGETAVEEAVSQEENTLPQNFSDGPIEEKYLIADEIESGVSFPEQPVEARLLQELPQAAAVAVKESEEDYSHYEENLPVNVIDQGKPCIIHDNRRKIRDMNIKVYAKPPYFGDRPVIAVVIDDMGDNVRRTRDISSLRAPITASFLTYPPQLERQVSRSLAAGHEIMVHVPMQPKSNINMTADILTVEMTPQQVNDNFRRMLTKFRNIRGVNNHMGSRLTEDRPRMAEIMKVLKEQGLFFLDSKTTPHSVGDRVAREYGVGYATRNVFLDNVNELGYILKQLAQTEKIARKNGYAIAIGHPKSQTYEALKQWLPTLEQKQIRLVPLSHIVTALNPRPSEGTEVKK